MLEPSRRSCPTPVGPEVADESSMLMSSIRFLLYGAPNWRCTTETQAYIRQAEAVHRRACLRVISGRAHVSYDATAWVRSPLGEFPMAFLRLVWSSPLPRWSGYYSKKSETRTTLTRWRWMRWPRSWMHGRTARWGDRMMAPEARTSLTRLHHKEVSKTHWDSQGSAGSENHTQKMKLPCQPCHLPGGDRSENHTYKKALGSEF
ncbi:unnamed protein product [Trichogramma brassicae]|uniref:Uncharacterized protein n=1 Tax=Trichogramma brassicae TaxID=86971 RepID=A0A6H5HY42_9HYME|nr:unnamed protein product [Trichogramma brassicae]